MKVKRYLVQDMNEAMIKIKNELGMDAVILNTRKIKQGGLFKFFNKPLLEVVAAIDEPLIKANDTVKEPAKIAAKEIETVIQPDYSKTEKEVSELKEMVSALIKKVENIESHSQEVVTHQEPVSISDKYVKALTDLDIQEPIAKKIIEIVQRQITISDKNHETVMNAIKVVAREYLGEIRTIDTDLKHLKPSIYMFLGPTGVGKTTTLAKIAAKLALVEGKSVGLITADTYRIAAVEQLKTYSEILGIPLEVIYEADELETAVDKFKDKDYILIDTAGRSHKSKELKSDYDELKQFLKEVDIFLVLSMTTSYRDLKSIIESYQFLDKYRLLFTKLDEANAFGNILNTRVLTGKALSYFTIGQSVPDDIEDADKEKIIEYIFDM